METEQLHSITDLELKQYTTLKIGGNAKSAYAPATIEEFTEILKFHIENNKSYNIIGAGSNLLISSEGVDGSCILTKNLKEILPLENNQIYSQCGVKSSNFSKTAYDESLEGAEFLIGIPGSIGGAIYMNAGAHGQNIKDIIHSVKIFDTYTCKTYELQARDINFSYRNSTFMDKKYIILSGIFKMNTGNQEAIKEKMDFHVNYRLEHHPPLTEYSAGSTFRNPTNDYAANLLEKVGAKEYIEKGKIRFSTKHANFLYNFNNASSTDAIHLIHNMWTRVYEQFGIKLHPEIRFIGKMSDKEKILWDDMTQL